MQRPSITGFVVLIVGNDRSMGAGSGRTLAAMIAVADLHVGYAAIAMDVAKPDSIAAPVKATVGGHL